MLMMIPQGIPGPVKSISMIYRNMLAEGVPGPEIIVDFYELVIYVILKNF